MSSIRVEEVTEEWVFPEESREFTAITAMSVDYVEVGLLLAFFVSLIRFIKSFCINKNAEKHKDE